LILKMKLNFIFKIDSIEFSEDGHSGQVIWITFVLGARQWVVLTHYRWPILTLT